MLNINQFKKIFPHSKNPEKWLESMCNHLENNEINTNERIAAFIAQCGHESGGWRVFEENLNYSSKSLNIVFPKYFIKAGRDAHEYHRQPEKIANVIYANRMGNGDTESGDGWKFRGRGPIQFTGRRKYEEFNKYIDENILENPDLLCNDFDVAIKSAMWFWNKNNLNDYADKLDLKGMTRRINGGYFGLEERIHYFDKIMDILDYSPDYIDNTIDYTVDYEPFGIIRLGSNGDMVALIQMTLHLNPDGLFGKNTENAVKKWQSENNLVPDGVLGPKSLEKMFG